MHRSGTIARETDPWPHARSSMGPAKWAILVLKLKKPRTEHWNRAFQIFALFV
jgi:hypothetical protein